MQISRRTFIKGFSFSLASLCMPLPLKAVTVEGPVIVTPRGKVRGMIVNGVHTFLGVPCGKPPYEPATRFKTAEYVDAWSGIVDCVTQPSLPLQGGAVIAAGEKSKIGADGKPLPGKNSRILAEGGEDCLRLNIWTPAPGAGKYPVMVYIPGGGSVSCNNGKASGHSFARDGVVLVSINYRVNVDGFMKIPGVPANLAIRDMIFALQWVKENIAAFGGDPDCVTVFGQSAGATHIGSLLASPLAKGLFERAILMSGSHLAQWTPEQSSRVSDMLFDYYGIAHTKEALLALPYEEMLNFRRLMAEKSTDPEWAYYANGNTTLFKPYVDGEVLLKRVIDSVADGAGKDVDVMIGSTADEWRYVTVPSGEIDRIGSDRIDFLLKSIGAPASLAEDYRKQGRGKTPGEIYTALQSDLIFRIPTNILLEARARSGGKTWAYSFNWESPAYDGKLKAAHGCDIPFVFDILADKGAYQKATGDNPPQNLADTLHKTWMTFARTGNPGWTPFDTQKRMTMAFNETSCEVSDPWKFEREAMKLK